MNADDPEVPVIAEESRPDGEPFEERRARNRAKLDVARERARRTIDECLSRRRRKLEAWSCIGDVATEVVLAAARERAAADGMSVEEAFGMLQGNGQTKH